MKTHKISYSSELMENFLDVAFFRPEKSFVALHADSGASLLFSISEDDRLMLTFETTGKKKTWLQTKISGDGMKVKGFAATQTLASGPTANTEIHIAMVVKNGTEDHLYISLANKPKEQGLIDKITWTLVPFNALDSQGAEVPKPAKFAIEDVSISEATDGEYIVVYTNQKEPNPLALLDRYYIDVTQESPRWVPHPLPNELSSHGFGSCLGRSKGERVDGLYIYGQIENTVQLTYQPLYDVYGTTPPPPSRLVLRTSNDTTAIEAITALRKPDNSSDLYVASNGSLYWFESDKQGDNAAGKCIGTHTLLKNVRKLYSDALNGEITIWGLNGSNEVFYMTCASGKPDQEGGWSVPLPILTGTDAISPYINRTYKANTFFAHTQAGFVKLVKSPQSGLWNRHPIIIPRGANEIETKAIHSYTTCIRVTDDTGNPVRDVTLALTASNNTSVLINHLYYLVGEKEVHVKTDCHGNVTIVELANTLAATRFLAGILDDADQTKRALPATLHHINPMDSAWKRNSAYDSVQKLREAQLYDRKGNPTRFLAENTPDETIQRVVDANWILNEAYNHFTESRTSLTRRTTDHGRPVTNQIGVSFFRTLEGDPVNSVLVELGDLGSWIESVGESVVKVVYDEGSKLWNLAVKIGGAAYHATLDGLEAVLASATWIYNQMKKDVSEILDFLRYIFDWSGIINTHQQIRAMLQTWWNFQVQQLDGIKSSIHGTLSGIRFKINSLDTNISDLGAIPSGAQRETSQPKELHGAPASFGIHHFTGGLGTCSSDLKTTLEDSIFDSFKQTLLKEEKLICETVNTINAEVIEKFASLSLQEIVAKLLLILTDKVLISTENVLVALLDMVGKVIGMAKAAIDQKIDFPVLSWLYRELTGNDLSILDLICLVAAIPVTIVYKTSTNNDFLIAIKDFAGLLCSAYRINLRMISSPPEVVTVDPEEHLKQISFAAGVLAFIGSRVLSLISVFQRVVDEVEAPDSAVLAGIAFVANMAYVSPNIPSSLGTPGATGNMLNLLFTGISVFKGFLAIPAAPFPPLNKTFAACESALNLFWNIPVIMNICENKGTYNATYKTLIPESIANFAFNFGGMLDLPVVVDKEPDSKAVMIASQLDCMGLYGLLIVASSAVYCFDTTQRHIAGPM